MGDIKVEGIRERKYAAASHSSDLGAMASPEGSSLDSGCVIASARSRTISRYLLMPFWSDPSMAFQMTSNVAILKPSAT